MQVLGGVDRVSGVAGVDFACIDCFCGWEMTK